MSLLTDEEIDACLSNPSMHIQARIFYRDFARASEVLVLAKLDAAPKALEPLTDKEVSRLWSVAHDDTTDRMAFQVLVRLVEKHHGITKGTPT